MEDQSLVTDALYWLDNFYKDIVGDPYYRKDSSAELLQRILWEIRLYDPEHRQAVNEALGYWLTGNDTAKVGIADMLVFELRLTQHTDKIEEILTQLEAGQSQLSVHMIPRLKATLTRLNSKED